MFAPRNPGRGGGMGHGRGHGSPGLGGDVPMTTQPVGTPPGLVPPAPPASGRGGMSIQQPMEMATTQPVPFKKGGVVKGKSRGDGIARKGKTKGRFI